MILWLVETGSKTNFRFLIARARFSSTKILAPCLTRPFYISLQVLTDRIAPCATDGIGFILVPPSRLDTPPFGNGLR